MKPPLGGCVPSSPKEYICKHIYVYNIYQPFYTLLTFACLFEKSPVQSIIAPPSAIGKVVQAFRCICDPAKNHQVSNGFQH